MESYCNNEFVLTKQATSSHLEGKINISGVPEENLPNIGQLVNVVLDEVVITANFILASSYRINKVEIGNWLQQKNVHVGDVYFIRICNRSTFTFFLHN